MKIVVNRCYGGYSLSPRAIKRLAELNGRECYFFKQEGCIGNYVPATMEEATLFYVSAFDIPNPDDFFVNLSQKNWSDMTKEEQEEQNDSYKKHYLTSTPEDRTDPKLIQVIEELDEEANGLCSKLEIVEIPDDVEWQIDEYEGREIVREKSREW